MIPLKPVLELHLEEGTGINLRAASLLSTFPEYSPSRAKRDLRHPLGTYNSSIARISDKLKNCAANYESHFRHLTNLESDRAGTKSQAAFLDYLELSLYAAAEHVDDVESILDSFFPSKLEFNRSKIVRKFKKDHKGIRDKITSYANAIKHAQSRIRVFSAEFDHDGRTQLFHGIFFEGYSGGALGPSTVLHQGDRRVFSFNSLLWEIVAFVTGTSELLSDAIAALTDCADAEVKHSGVFREAVIAIARLPIYAFDESHLFERISVRLHTGDLERCGLRSDIYGSLWPRWSKSENGQFLGDQNGYVADGVTRSFSIVSPKALRLQHWS